MNGVLFKCSLVLNLNNCVLILGSSREVVAPADISEQMVQKLRGKNEFTVLVTLKQDHLNSGVILSIHHSEHRFDPYLGCFQICLLYHYIKRKGLDPNMVTFSTHSCQKCENICID